MSTAPVEPKEKEEAQKEAVDFIKTTLNEALGSMRIVLKNHLKARLDATHRCDMGGCSSRGVVETTLHSGNALYWCLHHSKMVEADILPFVKEWYSEEVTLNKPKYVDPED